MTRTAPACQAALPSGPGKPEIDNESEVAEAIFVKILAKFYSFLRAVG